MKENETSNVNKNRGEQTILFYMKEYGLPYELAQLICKRYKFNKLNIDYFLNDEFRKVINLNNIKTIKVTKVIEDIEEKGKSSRVENNNITKINPTKTNTTEVKSEIQPNIGRIFTTKSNNGRSALLIEIYCNKPFVCQIRPFLIFGQQISNYLFNNLTEVSNKYSEDNYSEDNYLTKLPSNLKNGFNSISLSNPNPNSISESLSDSLSDSLSSLLNHLIKDSFTLNLIDNFINTYFCEIRLGKLSYLEIDKDLFNKNLNITYRKE